MSGEGFLSDQGGYYIKKKAGSILDYGFLWADWLKGDPIVSSVWSLPAGVAEVSTTHDDTSTTILISGSTAGEYVAANTVQTAAGLTDAREFRLIVEA